jgi:phospholipid/cholesterol/gamma-HCH transport system permease protein
VICRETGPWSARQKWLVPQRVSGESKVMSSPSTQAQADASLADGVLTLRVRGRWRITEERPDWHDLVGKVLKTGPAGNGPGVVRVICEEIVDWDSSLPLLIRQVRLGAESINARFESEGLPRGVEELEQLITREAKTTVPPPAAAVDLFTAVGLATNRIIHEMRDIARLVGECSFSIVRFFRGQAQFRWRDCLVEMQRSGVEALPIVSVIALLTGVILAYQAAAQLRQFGADIFVADMVGIAMVREMGPLMTAIVLAGRTGAAFAATLGSMKANEEIDALQTLGVSPVDFLVMPRISALFVMLPLLVLFANALGIIGGLLISLSILDIPANLYWNETKSFLDLSDLFTGLIKAATYGALIGLSGCLRGLQADRSAAGVGQAATKAVVTAIFLLIVANAIYAVIFNILGW